MKTILFLISLLFEVVQEFFILAIFAMIFGGLSWLLYHFVLLPKWDIPDLKMSDVWAVLMIGFLISRAARYINFSELKQQ